MPKYRRKLVIRSVVKVQRLENLWKHSARSLLVLTSFLKQYSAFPLGNIIVFFRHIEFKTLFHSWYATKMVVIPKISATVQFGPTPHPSQDDPDPPPPPPPFLKFWTNLLTSTILSSL